VILKQLLSYCTNSAQDELDKLRMVTALLTQKDVMLKNKLKFLHFTFSAIIFNRKRDHILMIYDWIKKWWTFFEVHLNQECEIIPSLIREIKDKTGLRKVCLLCNQAMSIQITEETRLPSVMPCEQPFSPHFHYNLTFAFLASMNHLTPGDCNRSIIKWIPLERIDEYVQSDSLLCAIRKVSDRCQLLV